MSFNVRQCRQCGRLFESFGSENCPKCVEQMDEHFNLVKDYIYDNPSANVVEIAKETEVPEKTILYFLKDGSLSISGNVGMLSCEKCGVEISSGRYCNACLGGLESAFSSVIKKPEPQNKKSSRTGTTGLGRMHYDIKKR